MTTHSIGAKGTGGNNAGITAYINIATGLGWVGGNGIGGEPQTQSLVGGAGVFSRLAMRVVTNDRGASTMTFRKNGSNGNQSVAIGSALTGEFFDSAHSDTVASGDSVNATITVGTGGTSFVNVINSVLFTSAVDTVFRYGSSSTGVGNSGASSTYYHPISSFPNGTASGSAPEANYQVKMKTAGKFRALRCYVIANSRASDTPFALRVNGADTALAGTITASTGGVFDDNTHTVTVAAGDLVSIGLTTGTGTSTLTLGGFWVEFVAAGGQHTWTSHTVGGLTLTAGASANYCAVGSTTSATETVVQTAIPQTQLFSGMTLWVLSNGITATSTVQLRKNAANANQVVSIGSGLSGQFFDDTTHSDLYQVGDLLNFQLTPGGTGTTLVIGVVEMLCTPSNPAAVGSIA